MVESRRYGSPIVTASSSRIAQRRIFGAGGLPRRLRDHGQHGQADRQQHQVQPRLPDGAQMPVDGVGVQIARQQHQLEEQQADGPHGRRAAEPGQNHLGDDRLHLKQQKGADENG